jgi:hypothetical protein
LRLQKNPKKVAGMDINVRCFGKMITAEGLKRNKRINARLFGQIGRRS